MPTAVRHCAFCNKPLLLLTALVVLFTGATCSSSGSESDGTRSRLSRVVDGDTIDVDIEGQIKRVRLILVDTPEVHGRVECYGAEASAYVKSLVPIGAVMTLESDVSERDRYGRLLRYVYLSDGRMLNEVLVRDGYATLATYPPDLKYVERIRSAEQYARTSGLGLWSACATTPTRTAGNCDPSYPDVCIPPQPPDLNCGDIPFRDFRVLPPDPHRFDGNQDGIGCQS
jgi:micrococcal nuclease